MVFVKHEVNCCAIAARLQKAVVTSMVLSSWVASLSRSEVASGSSVIASFSLVRMPHFEGTSRTDFQLILINLLEDLRCESPFDGNLAGCPGLFGSTLVLPGQIGHVVQHPKMKRGK